MNEIAAQVASQLILAAIGSLGTGIIWIARLIFQARKDLNIAHNKIRKLEVDYASMVARDTFVGGVGYSYSVNENAGVSVHHKDCCDNGEPLGKNHRNKRRR